jgi:tetratricopeptide (TPR) repeat protein
MAHSPELDHLATQWASTPEGTAFAALADGLRKVGALAEAEAIALVGLERHADLIPGLIALARIREAQGDLVGAEATLHRALGHDPTHPVVLESLAAIAAASGHDESARAWTAVAEAAEATDAEPPPARSDDADPLAEAALGEIDEDAWLDGAVWGPDDVEAAPEAPALVTESLARLYQQQGHLERAAEAFRTLADRHPQQAGYAHEADALEREITSRRPRPYDVAASGGTALGDWLAKVAAAGPVVPTSAPGFDAFYQAPLPAPRDTADFESFQDWLKGLGR